VSLPLSFFHMAANWMPEDYAGRQIKERLFWGYAASMLKRATLNECLWACVNECVQQTMHVNNGNQRASGLRSTDVWCIMPDLEKLGGSGWESLDMHRTVLRRVSGCETARHPQARRASVSPSSAAGVHTYGIHLSNACRRTRLALWTGPYSVE
jgi:hypothetical protein